MLGLGAGIALIAAPCGAEPAPAASGAPAQAAEPTPAVDPKLAQARELYLQGVELVKAAQWSGALAAFERSAVLRPHATTEFNIGACERAMGRYTSARESFHRALARARTAPDELAPSLSGEAEGFVAEIDRLIARVRVRLNPSNAAVAVDGRPLRRAGAAGRWIAGLEQPGPGQRVGAAGFELELNPGAHVITLSRKGYADAVINRSFAPGARAELTLELERLPATLHVSSNVSGALVMVDTRDVGPVPVSVLRPGGNYRVLVSKDGYEPYEAQVMVQAGEQTSLRAQLYAEKTPLTKRWWFWTAAAGVLVGGALATYALTRPDPEPPPYDGGSTGWVVRP